MQDFRTEWVSSLCLVRINTAKKQSLPVTKQVLISDLSLVFAECILDEREVRESIVNSSSFWSRRLLSRIFCSDEAGGSNDIFPTDIGGSAFGIFPSKSEISKLK